MHTKIDLSSLEEMLHLCYEENCQAFCRTLREHGVSASEKTLIRAVKKGTLGEVIKFPELLSLCRYYHYPLAGCFTFYTEDGLRYETKRPLPTNSNADIKASLLLLAIDIADRIERTSDLTRLFHGSVNIEQMAHEDIKSLAHIGAANVVEAIMFLELDFNNYFQQGDIKMPYQCEHVSRMVAERVHIPETHYLNLWLDTLKKEREREAKQREKLSDLHTRITEKIEDESDKTSALIEIELFTYNTFRL